MAEITGEAPNPPPDPPPNPPHDPPPNPPHDENSTRRTTKPGTKRLILTLTVLFSFVAGIPFFLQSTEIYRSPLPFDSIQSLSTRLHSNPPSLPCHFHAIFLRSPDPSLADKLRFLISEELNSSIAIDPICGGCGKNYTVSVTVDSCADLDFSGLDGSSDGIVDEFLDSALRREFGGGGRVYSVVVVEGEEEVRVVVGKHRHAWIVGKVEVSDAVEMIGEVFVKFFMNGGREGGEGKGEFMPVGLDGSVVLSFSLLNADPNDWVYDW